MIPLLLPTTEESGGVQRFIYRSDFPITFSVTDRERILDILFTESPLRAGELRALLMTFGFSPRAEVGTEQTAGGHIVFRQRLFMVDMPRGSVLQYTGRMPAEDCDMCCRYYIDDTADELLPYFEEAEKSPLTEKLVAKLGKALVTRGEVRPTDMVAGIALNKRGETAAFPMVWGYSVQGARGPVFNARSETAGERPMFRDGWTNRRCVLPASYFFEWGMPSDYSGEGPGGKKIKYAIQPKGEAVTWLAGIYRFEESGGVRFPVFTILTKDAVGDMRAVHDRMPVMLKKERIPAWLSPSSDPKRVLAEAIGDLAIERAGE